MYAFASTFSSTFSMVLNVIADGSQCVAILMLAGVYLMLIFLEDLTARLNFSRRYSRRLASTAPQLATTPRARSPPIFGNSASYVPR
ncbi:hypothetical protein K440DRAFT_26449 [Wilcoxina mikolae CBS 423.85]|nr:hypothetical protein K440DRAFT_26449 [Wilcoxina mikolae CBS 423.85]